MIVDLRRDNKKRWYLIVDKMYRHITYIHTYFYRINIINKKLSLEPSCNKNVFKRIRGTRFLIPYEIFHFVMLILVSYVYVLRCIDICPYLFLPPLQCKWYICSVWIPIYMLYVDPSYQQSNITFFYCLFSDQQSNITL